MRRSPTPEELGAPFPSFVSYAAASTGSSNYDVTSVEVIEFPLLMPMHASCSCVCACVRVCARARACVCVYVYVDRSCSFVAANDLVYYSIYGSRVLVTLKQKEGLQLKVDEVNIKRNLSRFEVREL